MLLIRDRALLIILLLRVFFFNMFVNFDLKSVIEAN